MYYDHWGLRESPFKPPLDPRDFYRNPNHEEALARLQFLVDSHRGLGLLLGPSGCGKSLLLEVLASSLLARGCRVAKVNLLGLEPQEMLSALAMAWGLNPDRATPAWQIWPELNDRLIEHRLQKIDTVVLLDDADEAQVEVLTQVTRLAHCQSNGVPRLTVVLSARPQRMSSLGRRLLELADLRIDLRPWELPDTDGYLHHVLTKAGRAAAVFSPAAVARLHELSGGVPRHINQVAELALLAAAGERLEVVDAHTIEAVCEELSAPAAV